MNNSVIWWSIYLIPMIVNLLIYRKELKEGLTPDSMVFMFQLLPIFTHLIFIVNVILILDVNSDRIIKKILFVKEK